MALPQSSTGQLAQRPQHTRTRIRQDRCRQHLQRQWIHVGHAISLIIYKVATMRCLRAQLQKKPQPRFSRSTRSAGPPAFAVTAVEPYFNFERRSRPHAHVAGLLAACLVVSGGQSGTTRVPTSISTRSSAARQSGGCAPAATAAAAAASATCAE